MPISFRCPKCQKKLDAPDSLAGKRVKCPHCGQVMQLPVAKPKAQQPREVLEDLKPPDPFGEPAPANPSGAAGAAGGLGLSGGFSEQQFDEMLADVGPRVDVKPSKSQEDMHPCAICHELIPRGSSRCPHCGEDFNQYFQSLLPKDRVSRGAPNAARKSRTDMYALGGIWILFGVIALGILFLVLQSEAANGLAVGLQALSALFWLTVGIATCRRAIWAVYAGLVMLYIGLAIGVLFGLLVMAGVFLSGFNIGNLIAATIGLLIGFLPIALLIALAQRCIRRYRQLR